MQKLHEEIYHAFEKKAKTYEQFAKVQKEIGTRLVERLSFIKLQPKYILDLGVGSGYFTKILKKMFPRAQIVGIDISYAMLLEAKNKQSFFEKFHLLQANGLALPFKNNSFDLIFSNQVLHWIHPLSMLYKEIFRILNLNGCFIFTTLGPDTFLEIRQSWSKISQFNHTNNFADMHDIGDELTKNNFADPVMDMEKLTICYKSVKDLVLSLKQQGVKNINSNRNPTLTGKTKWLSFINNYPSLENGLFPLSYEVLYGHAWKNSLANKNEYYFSLEDLKGKR